MSDLTKPTLNDQINKVLTNLERCRERAIDGEMWASPAQLDEVMMEAAAYITYLGSWKAEIDYRYYNKQKDLIDEHFGEMKKHNDQPELERSERITATETQAVVTAGLADLNSYRKKLDTLIETWDNFCMRCQSRIKSANEEARANR